MALNTISTYTRAQQISPSDTVDLLAFGQASGGATGASGGGGLTDAVLVVDGGNVAFVFQNGVILQLPGVPPYTVLPLGIRRVNATNTTAAVLYALYHL